MDSGFFWVRDNETGREHVACLRPDGDWLFSYEFSGPLAGIIPRAEFEKDFTVLKVIERPKPPLTT